MICEEKENVMLRLKLLKEFKICQLIKETLECYKEIPSLGSSFISVCGFFLYSLAKDVNNETYLHFQPILKDVGDFIDQNHVDHSSDIKDLVQFVDRFTNSSE